MTLAHAPHSRHLAGTLLLSLFVACTHSDAFTPHDSSTSEPLVAATPTRLTYNPQADVDPFWLPDGTGIIYAWGTGGALPGDRDQCLGELPATGGSLRNVLCNHGPFASDSIETLAWPAVSPGNRLAYSRTSRFRTGLVDATALVVGSRAVPDSFDFVRRFPFQIGSSFYLAPAYTSWLSDSLLVFIGLTDTPVPCPAPCTGILVRSGRDILRADLQGGSALVTAVPGSAWATSVARAGPADIYFTTAGSSQVFRQELGGGASTSVHDFGPGGIARDVQVANNRLAAIVGGLVQLRPDNTSTIQDDIAGRLFIVDLASGTERELAAPATLFRHPALSPDGAEVVVEAFPLRLDEIRGPAGTLIRVDTTVTGGPDLWMFPTQ